MTQPVNAQPDHTAIRTSGIVAEGQGDRLGKVLADAQNPWRRGLELFAIVAGTTLGITLARTLTRPGADAQDSTLTKVGYCLIFSVAIGVVATLIWCVRTVIVRGSQRSKMRKQAPAGAPMNAEFGSTGFGVRIGDYQDGAELASIKSVAFGDDGMVVTAQVDKRRTRAIAVPGALLTPVVVDHFRTQFAPAS